MEIKYTSTESDALALARFRSQYVPRVRRSLRIRHLGYSVGLALMGLGLCLVRAFFLGAVSLTLALLSALFFPRYRDWMLRRRVHKMYESEKMQAWLGPCTLRITDEGLVEESPLGEAMIKWQAIDDVTRTSTHTFITVAQFPSVVVPNDQAVAGDLERFFDECVSRAQSAKT